METVNERKCRTCKTILIGSKHEQCSDCMAALIVELQTQVDAFNTRYRAEK